MNENYINLQKDEETIRLTILSNLCRMMINRGYMNRDKYAMTQDAIDNPGLMTPISSDDSINANLFMSYFKKTDDNTYTIPMDMPFRDTRLDDRADKNVPDPFDGLSLIVKIVPQKVADIENSPIFNDFVKTYVKYHKVVIFDGMAYKAYTNIIRKHNIEGFDRDYLMIDYMSLVGAPIDCRIISSADIKHINNPKIAIIHQNDPLAKYYDAKKGDILRIVRPSINNNAEIGYRLVTDPKPLFY